MDWRSFGRELVITEDLDPVYVMLENAQLWMDPILLRQWLMAYWCFYDCGTASRIAESNDFWKECWRAYAEKWPRGTERRHFRGSQCAAALTELSDLGKPETIVENLANCKTFQEVSEKVQQLRGFGPWISWKIGDMLERVLLKPIDFSGTSLMMYSEPIAGAALIMGKKEDAKVTELEMSDVLMMMSEEFKDLKAPPSRDRFLNVQEYETILCKYKSHVHGHYPILHDCGQIARSLAKLDGVSKLAMELFRYVPNLEMVNAYPGEGFEA